MPRMTEKNAKEFRSHLSRHLQQLALDALPLSIDGLEIRDTERGEIGETESDTDEVSRDEPLFASGDERGVDSDALLNREQDGASDGPPTLISAIESHEATSRRSSLRKTRQTLWDAAASGHEAMVRLLLERGADTESKSGDGWTPLLYAAANGHETVVRLLLEKGADMESKDSHGRRPLWFAALNGREAIVRLLLEKGADMESKERNGRTPLCAATASGYEAIVRLLLENGADANSKDGNDRTPLSAAVLYGHEAVGRLLTQVIG